MPSSSSPSLERGLDTMLLVYVLLQGHPAAIPCEQFLRAHVGWFTSSLVLFEAKNILTKVYGVHAGGTTRKLLLPGWPRPGAGSGRYRPRWCQAGGTKRGRRGGSGRRSLRPPARPSSIW